jgi:hypothetical protein
MTIKIIALFCAGALLTGAFVLPTAKGTPNPETADSPPPSAVSQPTDPQPEELGAVHWLRDLDLGKAQATSSGKPLLILFQEVPGCSNCTRYGNRTLSHPLIVEAIETYFIPVCIYNNKGGKDAEALRKFGEPAWNNPVVHIARTDYTDVVPRMDNFQSSAQLISGIKEALGQAGTPVPKYLDLLEEEMKARESGVETATFSMYCFWSGEGTFGAIPGVVETAPGFQDGKEVVRVTFDPAVVKKEDLEKNTKPKGISSCSRNEGFRTDKDLKYYLAQTDYAYIPMTSLQACRANSLVGQHQSPDDLLSPRQLALLKKIQAGPDKKRKSMIGRVDLGKAWAEESEK